MKSEGYSIEMVAQRLGELMMNRSDEWELLYGTRTCKHKVSGLLVSRRVGFWQDFIELNCIKVDFSRKERKRLLEILQTLITRLRERKRKETIRKFLEILDVKALNE